jgi:transposase-like protein
MEDYPTTILEFEQRFATEKACQEYLFRLRWPEGFRCPRCGHDRAWLTSRGLYRCQRRDFQSSVTAGTIFHDSRKPLWLWFRAIWYVTNQKQGVSALGLQRVLGLRSYQTAWTWLHRLRRAMVRPGRDRLSGTVEVDETYVGGERPGKRGRGAAGKTLVVVAVEDTGAGAGRIRLHRVRDASADSLTPAVEVSVEPGTEVRTDDWDGYLRLQAKGYRRTIVRKTEEIGENLLPLANRVASLLKRWLLGTHQGAVQPSHLDYYLDEFTFRFNRRTSRSRGKLFYRLLQQATVVEPVTNKAILRGCRDG